MKLPDKRTLRKEKPKKKPITKPKKEKVLLVAQEFKFARLLSGNEKKIRDRVLKTLKRWLLNCFEKKYEFKEDDFVRVWKGLFYAVWMSDKPLVQEDLCESIAAILDLFPPEQIEYAIMMIKAGFKILAMEWYGIDQHRMDKFLMLVRRYLRGSFRCLQRCEWSLQGCQMFADMLCSSDGILAVKTPLYARNAASLMLHLTDCYLEEISKVSNGDIPEESLAALLYPISVQVCGGDGTLAIACRRVFTALIRQSELGLEYEIATSAWKKLGCPAGGPEGLERVSDDDDDNDDNQSMENDKQDDREPALDPRAGRVDVVLQPLPVPAQRLAEQLRHLMANATSRAHSRARICAERFEELSRNQYPLPVPADEAKGLESKPPRAEPKRAANRLLALEKQLVKESDELALRGLSRKHRKRLLAKTRSGINIVDELLPQSAPVDSTNGDWCVETTEEEDKNKQSEFNKENNAVDKKKDRKRKLHENNVKEHSKKSKTDKSNSSNQLESKNKNNFNNKKNINDSNDIKQSGKSDHKNNKLILNKDTNKVANSNNLSNGKEKGSTSKTNSKQNSKKGSKGKNTLNKENNKILNINKGKNKSSIDSNKVKASENMAKKKISQDKVLNFKTNKPINDANKLILKNQKDLNSKNANKNVKPHLIVNKVKNYQKQVNGNMEKEGSPKKKVNMETPKKVKFVLKNNSMQETLDYYKSVRQSPNIPFDSSKKPTKTNLKPSTPSPINPFFKKKLKLKKT